MNAHSQPLSDLGTAALEYAARGWPVFPLRPNTKIPLIPAHRGGRGHLDATTDRDMIKRWWTATPDANIGLNLAAAGLVALDPDLYKPECEWNSFIQGRDVPDTLTQSTPSGGKHFIFTAAEGAEYAGGPCKGVETKHAGYIVLEPSTFRGNRYRFDNDTPPAPCPAWVPRKGKQQAGTDTGQGRDNADRLAELLQGADAHGTARGLTLALGGRWYGRYGAAPCPVCQPERRREQDALTLADGGKGLLAHCKKSACRFRDIATAAGIAPGTITPPDPFEAARRRVKERADAERKAGQAQRLWQQAQPLAGTVAERYLREARGIHCDLPQTLRFAPACWHPTAQRFPALIALVEGGEGAAVHRTYLRPDGSGKAEAQPDKAMLGATAGGAVRLAEMPGRLVVTEGIENALSLLCGLLEGPAAAWAALSTFGLRGLRLPSQPGRLTIAPDGDAPGRVAAYALAARAHALGWQVALCEPPAGADWNDVLIGKAAA